MKGENLSRKVTPEIINKLQEIVGIDNVNTNDMDRMLYGHDLAPLPKEAGLAFKNMPDVIVRPSTTEQVSAIVKLAYETGVAIVPRGQSTWGLGGSMPVNGGILIDMASKMNNIIKIRDQFQIAVMLIEHDMNLVMGICEGICVLNYGRIIAKGTAEEIQNNPTVIEAYLGKKKEG